MAIPRLSIAIVRATIVEWKAKEGERIRISPVARKMARLPQRL